MLEQKLREASQARLEKAVKENLLYVGLSYFDAPLDEDEYIDSVGKGTGVEELSIWDSNDTVTKDVGFDRITMLEPTARNMHMLMLKINELVGVINELK